MNIVWPEPCDSETELRHAIALLEADHRRQMQPFYESLARHAMRKCPVYLLTLEEAKAAGFSS